MGSNTTLPKKENKHELGEVSELGELSGLGELVELDVLGKLGNSKPRNL